MTRGRRWLAGSVAALALVLAALALFIHSKLPDDEALAAELGARFEASSGVGLRVGRAHWTLRPSPVVVLEDLATAQPEPITVRRVVVRPRLSALWNRRIAIDAVEIENAVLPRQSVRAFRGKWQSNDALTLAAGAWTLTETPVEHLRLRDVVWVDRRNIALAYDLDLRFDPGWRPREGELRRPGVTPPAVLRVDREGGEDRWRTRIEVGGGTWSGSAELATTGKAPLRLVAQLEPKDVDIGALVRTFGRHSAIEGKIRGQTSLDAEGADASELLRRLHTRTRFSIAPAAVDGFDLSRIVTTGSARGGKMPLDSLTGTLDTQATDDGVIMRYSDLKARSGALSASGNATVFNRKLEGRAAIDVVDGVVGLPIRLGGTLDEPQVSLTGGALAGAAVGTAVLPGVGTALGARIGQEVEKLFGDDDAKKPKREPPR